MNTFPALKQFWLRRGGGIWAWTETVIVTVLILAACRYVNPQNPLFLKEIFPWPWLAAVIVVLQYGFGPGLFSAVLITGAVVFQGPPMALTTHDYQYYLLSGLILTFVCAMFSAGWQQRVTSAEGLRTYTEERLNNLSRSYYLLHVSYDYLEQNLITKPITLRMVMGELQKMLIAQKGKLDAETSYRFLQIVGQYCSALIAGIYLYEHKKLNNQPLAEIGAIGPLEVKDPLIVHCQESTDIAYITGNPTDDVNKSQYVVAAPMRTDDGNLLGMVVIKEMSFWNLTHESLRVLNILIAYFIEEFTFAANTSDILQIYPDCPASFAKEFKKLLGLKNNMNIDSALTAVMVSKELRSYNVIPNLEQQKRTLDYIWPLEKGNYDILILLMPFTNAAGIQGYNTRISNYIKANLGFNLDQKQIKTRSQQLTNDKPSVVLKNFLTYLEDACAAK